MVKRAKIGGKKSQEVQREVKFAIMHPATLRLSKSRRQIVADYVYKYGSKHKELESKHPKLLHEIKRYVYPPGSGRGMPNYTKIKERVEKDIINKIKNEKEKKAASFFLKYEICSAMLYRIM